MARIATASDAPREDGMPTIAESALGLLSLVIFLAVVSVSLIQSRATRRIQGHRESLEDPIYSRRASSLRLETWKRIRPR